MKRIVPIEPRYNLPRRKRNLHPPLRYPPPPLVAEQRCARIERLVVGELPVAKRLEFTDQRVRLEHVSHPATLGDLGPDADTGLWLAGGGEHVTYVQADDFGEAQAGAEGYANDEVVAGVGGGYCKQGADCSDLVNVSGLRVGMGRLSQQTPYGSTKF